MAKYLLESGVARQGARTPRPVAQGRVFVPFRSGFPTYGQSPSLLAAHRQSLAVAKEPHMPGKTRSWSDAISAWDAE